MRSYLCSRVLLGQVHVEVAMGIGLSGPTDGRATTQDLQRWICHSNRRQNRTPLYLHCRGRWDPEDALARTTAEIECR